MNYFLTFLAGILLGILITLLIAVKKFVTLKTEIAKLNAEKNSDSFNIDKKLFIEFENIANKVLKQNSEDLSVNNNNQLENILKPFKEKITDFEQRIEKNYIEKTKSISSLEAQIKLLSENNKVISKEALNLANALKNQSKIRGDWGEVVLNKILEHSGLQKNIHYSVQETFKSPDNKLLRPDVIINLPDERHIIIDSKLSLISYEKYFNDEANREQHLKSFVCSIKDHIKDLKSKHYQNLTGLYSPDFVLMFIPVEACYSLVFESDGELFDFAWKNRVILVGPTVLLATLKSIEFFWQKEKQNQNVIEIAEESGKLYDKFVGLLLDIENIRGCFDKTLVSFENMRRKLDGRGNLINQVEKIKKLGAKTSRSIPEEYLSRQN